MKKALRKALKISAVAAGALVALLAAAVLLVLFDKPLVRKLVVKQISKGAGSSARIGRLDYTLFPFRVSAAAVEIGREDRFQKLTIGLDRLEARGGVLEARSRPQAGPGRDRSRGADRPAG